MPLPDRETLCATLDAVDVGVALVGPDDRIQFCNVAYGELVGRSVDELLDRSLFGPGSPCDGLRPADGEKQVRIVSFHGTSPTGEPVEVVVRPLEAGADVRLVVVRRAMVRSVSGHALPPHVVEEIRRYVAELTGHEPNLVPHECGSLSILLLTVLDLDRLDGGSEGEAAETALHEVARALVLQKRKADIIIRRGAGQFLLLAPDTPRYGAIMLAERIREAVAEIEIVVDGRPVPVRLLTYAAEYRPDLDGAIGEAIEKAAKLLEERAAETVA